MRKNKLIITFSIFSLILLLIFQSCIQNETYDLITEKKYDSISEKDVINEYINAGFKIVNSTKHIQKHTSSKDLREALTYLDEYRIDTTFISIECLPLTSNKLKTRSEGGFGTRYGVTITQERTFLTHKIYMIYTKISDIYTIESVSYEIDGFRLGNISTSVGNINQSSSTSSEFETTATYTINIGSYEIEKETTRYRWNIYFQGGSSISFSANEI